LDKLTYLYKEDLPDQPGSRRDIEAMQEEYLIDRIGLTLWGYLCQREMEQTKKEEDHGNSSEIR